ncbi:MAG TPA: hypothetical protein VIT65_29610 [Microlunatus sp.]
MSGVIHPMGPEPAQTYWVRRGVLLAVVLLLAVIVVFGVANLTKAAVATSPPPVIPPVAASPEPSTAASPSTAPSTSVSAPAPSGSASDQPSASAPIQPSSQPPSSTAAKPSAAPTARPSATATVIGTPDCTPAGLRVTVKADRSLSPGQKNTFALTMVNAGAQTCLVSVTDKNFELKVFSGEDRIWSSRDCAKTLVAFDKKLAGKAGVIWKMTWNGERSVKGKECKRGTGTPRAGTYWATAQLAGAKPVQLRMIIA